MSDRLSAARCCECGELFIGADVTEEVFRCAWRECRSGVRGECNFALEPVTEEPPTLDELLEDVDDLIEHARHEGYDAFARLLEGFAHVVRTDRAVYERAALTLAELPPNE